MIRIFFTLSLFALLCVAAALLLGIQVEDLHGVIDPDVSPEVRASTIERAGVHRRAGLAAAIVAIFANSISVTYFIGTNRWCKEVVERYSLDTALFARSVALKRRTFPWAASSMLVMVGVAALGAAADPGTGMPNTADWVLPHFIGGLSAVAFLGYSFFVQWMNIRAQYEVIGDIMGEVRRAREARGLSV